MTGFALATRALDEAIRRVEEHIEYSRGYVDRRLRDVRGAEKALEMATREHDAAASKLVAYRDELAELRAARTVLEADNFGGQS